MKHSHIVRHGVEKGKREGMCLNGMNKVREMSHKAISQGFYEM